MAMQIRKDLIETKCCQSTSKNSRTPRNMDMSIPEPMSYDQVEQMRRLIPVEAWNHAERKSIDLCAMYVRQAIERSHEKITGRPLYMRQKSCAYDYGESLLNSGFRVVHEECYQPLEVGDIAVYQRTPTSPWGHIQIFCGNNVWVSDYRQPSKFPDRTYVNAIPVYYRFFGSNNYY